uniref:Uncharacterized protein n=1 Tax=Nelumbo nucifera TaxID=4432 RepID=A0A822ZIA9_NELNU|nr:TPA_asm: hypothetical protein HUJ06_003102 [Nelumbo nucifera]
MGGHMDHANVNVRLSVNMVWSVHADTKRFETHTKGPRFFHFVSPGDLELLPPNPFSIGDNRAPAVHRWWRVLLFFFSSPFFFFSSSSTSSSGARASDYR